MQIINLRPATILLGLSLGQSKAQEVLVAAIKAFRDLKGVKVLIKCHPFNDSRHVLRGLKMFLPLPPHFEITDTPMEDLLRETKGLFVWTESMSSLQALGFGWALMLYVGSTYIGAEIDPETAHFYTAVYSPQEMAVQARRILKLDAPRQAVKVSTPEELKWVAKKMLGLE